MSPIVWLVFGIILLVIEMLTPGLFFFSCFGLGALAASLLALLGTPIWVAWVVFFTVSLLLILFVAPLARRWMKKMTVVPVGLDSLEGQTGRIIQVFDTDGGKGQVRLKNGAVWRAISDHPMTKDSTVEIICVIGTSLQVKPVSEATVTKEQS